MKIYRNHLLNIFYGFFKLLKQFISIFIGIGLVGRELGIFKSLLIALAVCIMILAIEIINWRKDFFTIRENSIYYQNGLFKVNKTEIHFSRIHTVDISQNIVEKVFNASTIKIDTGESKSKGSELKFVLNRDTAFYLKDILSSERKQEGIDETTVYKAGAFELFIYAVVSNSVFKGIGVLFVIQNFINDYIEKIFSINTQVYVKQVEAKGIYIIAAFVIFLLFLGIVISVIGTFFKYYGFKVFKDSSKINISYGVFNKKNYSFEIKKINGVNIKRTVFMQIFGFSTLEIESIGYGDEEGERAVLYPICTKKMESTILAGILENFQYNGDKYKVSRNGFGRFFYKKILFWIVVFSGFFIFKRQYAPFTFILLVLLFEAGILEIKNSHLGIFENLIYIGRGAFNKEISIIKVSAVQAVTKTYNYFQERHGFCDYKISIYSSSSGKLLKVKNLKNNILANFK